jgi:hypothetical protein
MYVGENWEKLTKEMEALVQIFLNVQLCKKLFYFFHSLKQCKLKFSKNLKYLSY